jgi:predicted MFS family arabinose efflux permease
LHQKLFNRFKPNVWLIISVSLLNSAALSISLPFLALYLYDKRGVSMTSVGLIMLVTGLCSAAAQLLGGALSDRFGRRPPLLVSIAASAIFYLGMAYLISDSAPILIIAVTYAAVRSALTMAQPVITALLVDLTPKEQLTEAYGLLRVGQNLGWAIGPALGGYLLATVTYGWLFGIAGLTTVFCFLMVFNRFKESLNNPIEKFDIRNVLSVSRNKQFFQFTVISLVLAIVMAQMSGTLSVFTVTRAGLSTEQYGLLLTLNGLMVVFFQYPLARISSGIRAWKVLVVASLLYGVGYLTMAWVGAFIFAIIGMIIVTLGEISNSPTALTVTSNLAPPEARGLYMGFYGLSGTLGLALGPLIGGILLDAFPTNSLYVWGIICIIAVISAAGFYCWGTFYVEKTRKTNID